ncbi:hypothetical protein PIB30_101172, partial [Stylosanthes scabra]|nr:hypothetical protein [Stylosanthes scabra]
KKKKKHCSHSEGEKRTQIPELGEAGTTEMKTTRRSWRRQDGAPGCGTTSEKRGSGRQRT